MNKVIKEYTYDEFGMYANGEPVRPIVCLLLLGLLRVPISVILLFVGCVFLPGGIILMLAANTSTNGTADRNHQTATTDGTSH